MGVSVRPNLCGKCYESFWCSLGNLLIIFRQVFVDIVCRSKYFLLKYLNKSRYEFKFYRPEIFEEIWLKKLMKSLEILPSIVTRAQKSTHKKKLNFSRSNPLIQISFFLRLFIKTSKLVAIKENSTNKSEWALMIFRYVET
jgi:hypothetical protein